MGAFFTTRFLGDIFQGALYLAGLGQLFFVEIRSLVTFGDFGRWFVRIPDSGSDNGNHFLIVKLSCVLILTWKECRISCLLMCSIFYQKVLWENNFLNLVTKHSIISRQNSETYKSIKKSLYFLRH